MTSSTRNALRVICKICKTSLKITFRFTVYFFSAIRPIKVFTAKTVWSRPSLLHAMFPSVSSTWITYRLRRLFATCAYSPLLNVQVSHLVYFYRVFSRVQHFSPTGFWFFFFAIKIHRPVYFFEDFFFQLFAVSIQSSIERGCILFYRPTRIVLISKCRRFAMRRLYSFFFFNIFSYLTIIAYLYTFRKHSKCF